MSALRLTPEQYAAAQARAKRAPAAKAKPTRADLPAKAPRASKYLNRATAGYSSAKEATRAAQLRRLEQAGQIRNLREQVSFELIPKQGKERACKYVADFCYDEPGPDLRADGSLATDTVIWRAVVEDCKGYKKGQAYALFAIKRKLLLLRCGIAIRET